MGTFSRWTRVLIIAAGLAAVPVAFGGTGRVTVASACAADGAGGTCCDGAGTCYPNNCSDDECARVSEWWRSDGKPCDAVFPEG